MRVKARYERRGLESEELRKATPTMIGKPVTLNFHEPRIGVVIDAQFNNDGVDLELDLWDIGGGYMYDVEEDESRSNIVFTELSLAENLRSRGSEQSMRDEDG